MQLRILALALTVGLLALPIAAPAAASGTDPAEQFDAAVVVSETDLPALLASGILDDYSVVTAAELGLDEAALAGLGQFADDSVLTPSDLGLGTPGQRFSPFFGGSGFFPFFRGFATLNGMLSLMFRGSTISTTFTNVPVPFFRFRPIGFSPFFSSFGFSPFLNGRTVVIRTCC